MNVDCISARCPGQQGAASPKPMDRRQFGGDTAQAEASAPGTLADIVRVAIEEHLDRAAHAALLAEERDMHSRLAADLAPALRRVRGETWGEAR